MEHMKLVLNKEIGVVPSSHGFEYEARVTLFTALTAALTFDHFEIKTNVRNFEPLDDIYLRGSKHGKETLFLVQLKHVAKSTTLEDNFFINEIRDEIDPKLKIQNKPKFDLIRFNNKYIELSKKLKTNNINFIFYTNYKLDVKSTFFLKNDNVENAFVKSLNTSTKQQSFLLNENCDKLKLLNERFIRNTYFLTNQENVDDISNSILNLLVKLQISEDLGPLIIGNLFHIFNNICVETKNKPLITKSLTLQLLYFSCLNHRSIPISKFSNTNSDSVYSPYLWDYLKKSKVIIKKEHVDSIQNMIFNHDDSIQNDNPILQNLLFKHKKYDLTEVVKKYFVQCCCGLLPFLIDSQYHQEVINIVNIFNKFRVIFVDSNDNKYIESKFSGVSSEFCEEIFKIRIRPLNRNECLIKDIFENRDQLKLILNNVNISDFLQICKRDELKDDRKSVELERFVYKIKIENSLNDLVNDDVVVLIDCYFSKNNLINFYKLTFSEDLINVFHETKVLASDSKILVLNHSYNKYIINLFKTIYKNENVHFLKVDQNGLLFWVNTFGSLKNIIFAKTNPNNTLKLKQLPDFFKFNHLIVFSGIPGIGKSVSMNLLSNFIPSNIYVLLIKLTEHQQILNNLTDDINCLELLKTLSTEKSEFYLNILELKFKHKDLCVILDGYDEVAPTFIKTTNNLINSILREKIQIVLTSRTIFQNEIEKEFSTKSLILKPFDLKEQTQYLEQYFSQNSKLNRYDITNKCADIVNKMENNLIGDREFNSVPLHLKIICDILLDLFKQSNFDTTNIRIDKLTIFKTFIDKKLRIFKEKTKTLNLDEYEIKEYHQKFSLLQIFPHFIDTSMQEYIKGFSQKLKRGSEKIGLLLDDVNEIFIHRIIAEYFTASWIVDNCENNSLSKELFINEIFKKEYYFIYYCCNSFLYKETSVYNKIVSNNFNEITSEEINQKYLLNRNILHLVILNFDLNYKSNVISTNLEEFLKRVGLEYNNFITQRDYFELTPFDYSEKLVRSTELIITIKSLKNNFYFYFNQNFSLLEFLCCKNIKISHSQLKFENGFELFMFTINAVNLTKFNFIFLKENYDKENNERLINDYKIGFEWLIELGETINNLHYKAMDINSVQLSSFLLEKYNSNDFFKNINKDPLSYAFSNNLFTFIKLFMENENLTKYNTKSINDILNQFIKDIIINNNDQLLRYLLGSNYKLNELEIYNQFRNNPEILNIYKNLLLTEKNDKLSNTTIHLIILSKNNKKYPQCEFRNANLLNLLEYVIKTQNNINSENKNYETPLHLAIQNIDLETIKTLIKLKVDVNFKNNLQTPYLHSSLNVNNLEIMKLLLENKTNIEALNNVGDTALLFAIKSENLEAVKMLLDFNANINTTNNNHSSSLCISIQFNKEITITKLLLEKGVNIENADLDGNTPLFYAIFGQNLPTLKLLIQFKAKINVQNKHLRTPLHIAVEKDSFEIVNFLLRNGTNIEAVDLEGNTPLMIAIRLENIEAVKILLDFDASINTINNNNLSPLCISARFNKERTITKHLLEKGADIENADLYGDTPLLHSIFGQNLPTLKLLIQFKAKVNVQNKQLENPLHIAVKKDSLEILTFLLGNGISIEAVDFKGNTPLIIAIRCENLEAVKILLDFDANINTTNNNHSSPLCISTQYNKETTITKLLLENGADIENEDILGNTSLINAIFCQNLPTLKLLFQFNAKINVQNKQFKTPLHVAVEKDSLKIVTFLLENGTNTEVVDFEGSTPLMIAIVRENLEAVKILLDFGANINTTNNDYSSPLCISIQYNKETAITKLLLEKGADIENADILGNTPLFCAVFRQNLPTLKLLIQFKAKINVQNKQLGTPLHVAIKKDSLEIVRFLLENGTNTEAVDFEGNTPLMIAIRLENLEAVKILLDFDTNINKTNSNHTHTSPLCISSLYNKETTITKLLLEKGADIENGDILGNTPLFCAVFSQNLPILKLLIQFKAKINVQNKQLGTPLHVAIEKDSLEIVRFLLENETNTEAVNFEGNTPLMIATRLENLEAVKILLEFDANINTTNNNHSSPLCTSTRFNKETAITKLLLEKGADIESADILGNTPIFCAVVGQNLPILKLLIQFKAKVNVQNRQLLSPLQIAVLKDSLEIVTFLLENEATINTTDYHQSSPLNISAQFNKETTITNLLLERGADIENVDLDGDTPLLCAVVGKNLEILKLLIQFGAKINIQNKELKTPLHIAVEEDSLEIVKILIHNRADLNIVDEDGHTPSSLALHFKNNKIIQLLNKDKEWPIATMSSNNSFNTKN